MTTGAAGVSLSSIVEFFDATLNVAATPDYPHALNGIQLSNSGSVRRAATAVDFSSATIRGTVDADAQLLIVHHGMFWGGGQPIPAHRRERLRLLIEHDIAVYAAHLPLDIHPRLGNNALLARRLGLTPSGGFARYQTIDVGLTDRK